MRTLEKLKIKQYSCDRIIKFNKDCKFVKYNHKEFELGKVKIQEECLLKVEEKIFLI